MRTTRRVNPLFFSALFLAVWIAGFSVLTWDEKLFYVDYRPVAANIRPYYIIISLTEEAGPDRDPAGRDAGGSL